MDDIDKQDIYIIPHNYTDAGKILGFIDEKQLRNALLWVVPATYVNFYLLPVTVSIKIYILVLGVLPPSLVFFMDFAGFTWFEFVVYYFFKFCPGKRAYYY